MIYGPVPDLTPGQRHKLAGLQAAYRNSLTLARQATTEHDRRRATQLVADCERVLSHFWRHAARPGRCVACWSRPKAPGSDLCEPCGRPSGT